MSRRCKGFYLNAGTASGDADGVLIIQ